jgi:hypothetical protein
MHFWFVVVPLDLVGIEIDVDSPLLQHGEMVVGAQKKKHET